MKTSFTARHFNASQRLQNYAIEATSKLDKFFEGNIECNIVLEPHADNDNPQQAEIHLRLVGASLIATERAPSYEQAILKAVDNMKRQMIKHKKKHFDHA